MDRRETWKTRGPARSSDYVQYDAKGRPTYVIRQSRGGYGTRTLLRQDDAALQAKGRASTHTHSLQAALAHYKRFDADPVVYGSESERRKDPIYLTHRLILDFLTWSRDEKKNTPKRVHSQKLYLDWWKKKLGRVDLRRLSYTDQA